MRNLIRTEILLVLGLMLLGTFIVFSASGTYSEFKFHDYYFLFKNHIVKVIIAILAMIVMALIPYDFYKKISKPSLLIIIVMLLITLILNQKLNGAARWISLGFLNFQPSEIAKIILIMHIAKMIESKGELIKDFDNGFKYFLIWIILVASIVVFQPNFSTAIIICLISFTLIFIGGGKLSHLLAISLIGFLAGIIVFFSFPHVKIRLIQYFSSLFGIGELNMQVLQAKIGLGSGGVVGVGFGLSRQSDLFLPESYTDFIFSILGEELGFIGAMVVLLIYFAIFITGVLIAKRAKDKFAHLLAFGISFNIIITALINVAVVTGLVPTTGITLPFISYGGTSIIIFAASVGILINIAQSDYMSSKTIEEKI